MKTRSWKESDRETITYIDSSGIFGKLFAYLNDICQDEKKPANSLDSLTRHQLWLFCWYREHLWKNLGSEWKEFTVSKKAPGTTASWKAWRSQETTLKRGERKESCYVELSMRTLGLHTRGWIVPKIVQGNVCSCLNSGILEGSFKLQMPTIKGASQVSDPFYRWVNRCIWMPWHPDLLYWISDLFITEPNG